MRNNCMNDHEEETENIHLPFTLLSHCYCKIKCNLRAYNFQAFVALVERRKTQNTICTP